MKTKDKKLKDTSSNPISASIPPADPGKKKEVGTGKNINRQREVHKHVVDKIKSARRNPAPKYFKVGETLSRAPEVDKLDHIFSKVEAFASGDPDFHSLLINQICNSTGKLSVTDEIINGSLAAVLGIGPKNETEALLASQMVACHNTAMECLRRAAGQFDPETADKQINQATKLMRTFTMQMDVLNRNRGNSSQQKVTVEHVHVHEGGQAIVGSVGHFPKKEGEGVN
jgi:hypothetical protein